MTLLTLCTCIDPRKIDPSTGHYPGCPDEIIPPSCLLPPWEVVTTPQKDAPVKDATGRILRWEKRPPLVELVPPARSGESAGERASGRAGEQERAAPLPAPPPVPPPPAFTRKPSRKPARSVPSGPSLFDRIATKEPA